MSGTPPALPRRTKAHPWAKYREMSTHSTGGFFRPTLGLLPLTLHSELFPLRGFLLDAAPHFFLCERHPQLVFLCASLLSFLLPLSPPSTHTPDTNVTSYFFSLAAAVLSVPVYGQGLGAGDFMTKCKLSHRLKSKMEAPLVCMHLKKELKTQSL